MPRTVQELMCMKCMMCMRPTGSQSEQAMWTTVSMHCSMCPRRGALCYKKHDVFPLLKIVCIIYACGLSADAPCFWQEKRVMIMIKIRLQACKLPSAETMICVEES